jgi:hypothetical protein
LVETLVNIILFFGILYWFINEVYLEGIPRGVIHRYFLHLLRTDKCILTWCTIPWTSQHREGDYVLLEYPDLGLGELVPTFRMPRKGTFEVTQRVNAKTYRIRDLVSQRESAVNIGLLVPYHIHPLFATPLTVSEHEQEEWIVESEVDHEPDVIPRDTRQLHFLVRFRGLPDTRDQM